MRGFDPDGELERGHRVSEVMLNLLCVKMTGQTCDERFAGTTGSARVPNGLGYLGEVFLDWHKEVQAQAMVAAIVEEADEFDEDGVPTRMPPHRTAMLQPIRTPGGVMQASARPVGDLAETREVIPGFGEAEHTCWSCWEDLEDD